MARRPCTWPSITDDGTVSETLELLLEHGADANGAMGNGATPLHVAIHYRRWHVARLCLGYGAVVNATDGIGASPLMRAASIHGDVDMVRLLLFYGADPNLGEPMGKTPLYMALFTGHLETARVLLVHGAHTNVAEARQGIPPLIVAAQKGHVEIISKLLEHQADVNATTRSGFSALHWACNEDEAETVRVLLAAGADPRIASAGGLTPVMIAMEGRRVKHAALIVETLLRRARQEAWPAALRRGLVHAVRVLPPWNTTANLVRALTNGMTETPRSLRPQMQHALFVELYRRRGGCWF